jgi:hypothetical protein
VSRTQIIYVVVGACAVLGLGAWVGMILVPSVERLHPPVGAARGGALSLYVAATMAGLGIFLGVIVVPWAWDRIHS